MLVAVSTNDGDATNRAASGIAHGRANHLKEWALLGRLRKDIGTDCPRTGHATGFGRDWVPHRNPRLTPQSQTSHQKRNGTEAKYAPSADSKSTDR